MTKLLLIIFIAIITSSYTMPGHGKKNISDIKDDETVVFFRTSAWQDPSSKQWHIPIHGWIYEPQDSQVRKGIFNKILKNKYNLTVNKANQKYFDERVNLLISDNERGKTIVIKIAGKTFTLPESTPNGHFQNTIRLDNKTINTHARNNVLTYTAITRSNEKRNFSGEVLLVPTTGYSVISDIDDTVKISYVTNHKKLLEYTFLKEFKAVPGMAKLYRQWQSLNASFHYVSSSPWYLYPPLQAFTDKNRFPKATFSLKDLRFRDETLFNLFKKGTETKPDQIEPILQRYPLRKFVLVGDSGEQDPEVYADIYRKYPGQIEKIYIRNVTKSRASDSRFKITFAGIDHRRWQLFTDTAKIGRIPGQ